MVDSVNAGASCVFGLIGFSGASLFPRSKRISIPAVAGYWFRFTVRMGHGDCSYRRAGLFDEGKH